MECHLKFIVFCVFISQVRWIRGEGEVSCIDVKEKLDQVNPEFEKIKKVKQGIEKQSAQAVTAVNELNGEILKYTLSIRNGNCEDKDKKQQVYDLLKKINTYKTNINADVNGYTKKIADTTTTFSNSCRFPTAGSTTEAVANEVLSLLDSITASATKDAADLEKFKTDMVAENTIANTKKLSADIFTCVFEYDFTNINRDITNFNDSLSKHLDEVDVQKNELSKNLTEEVEKFKYTIDTIIAYDKRHGKHEFSKCTFNINVTARVEQAGKNCYKSFANISKNITDSLNNYLKKEHDDTKTKLQKCTDITCIDGVLEDTKTLQGQLSDVINNYKENVLTPIVKAKMLEASQKFDKDVDDTMNCYMKLLSSGSSRNISWYMYSLTSCILLYIINYVFVRV